MEEESLGDTKQKFADESGTKHSETRGGVERRVGEEEWRGGRRRGEVEWRGGCGFLKDLKRLKEGDCLQ